MRSDRSDAHSVPYDVKTKASNSLNELAIDQAEVIVDGTC